MKRKPISPREAMAKALIDRGHATLEDMLTASYGVWPPKGLDIVRQANVTVKVSKRFSDLDHYRKAGLLSKIGDHLTVAGYALWRADNSLVVINPKLCTDKPGIIRDSNNKTLGHEAMHILQYEYYYNAHKYISSPMARRVESSRQDLTCNEIANQLFAKHKNGWLSRQFNAVSRCFVYNLRYYKKGIEIQARLHELMMESYQAWGRLPTNKTELQFALLNCGLKMPQHMQQTLKKEYKNALAKKIFFDQKVRKTSETSELNYIYRALTEAGKEQFWNHTLPALYADLIEMYGDRLGRERFGLGKSPYATQPHKPM